MAVFVVATMCYIVYAVSRLSTVGRIRFTLRDGFITLVTFDKIQNQTIEKGSGLYSHNYCQFPKYLLMPWSQNHQITSDRMCKHFLNYSKEDHGIDYNGIATKFTSNDTARAATCDISHAEFYHTSFISETEKDFPVAFEMLIHYKKGRAEQYLRLLKYLYRPHNTYCIHIDKKAPHWWKNAIHKFAACFDNIIIANNSINVQYATTSILYAHLSCLKDLERSTRPWNYAITLHTTELPLVTNREIIDELIKMNGSNIIDKGIDATDPAYPEINKWITYKVKWSARRKKIYLSREKLGPVPHNLPVYKSAAAAESALTRDFVKFILTDKRGQQFLRYLKDVKSGVEFYFPTMNRLPDAPGGLHTVTRNMPHTVYREWITFKNREVCIGQHFVHEICIASVMDLPRLREASENMKWWFYNKYLYEYDNIVMDCMEMLLLERRLKEYDRDCNKGIQVLL